jgi:hypothetical protein
LNLDQHRHESHHQVLSVGLANNFLGKVHAGHCDKPETPWPARIVSIHDHNGILNIAELRKMPAKVTVSQGKHIDWYIQQIFSRERRNGYTGTQIPSFEGTYSRKSSDPVLKFRLPMYSFTGSPIAQKSAEMHSWLKSSLEKKVLGLSCDVWKG